MRKECKGTVTGSRRISFSDCGLKVTIVDFALSRCNDVIGEPLIFKDLMEEDWLFDGAGDEQYDVFREMRDLTG